MADSTDRSLISAAQLNRHRVTYRVVLTLIVVIFTLIFIPLGLTISQWISILIFTAGVLLHLWRRRYPLQPPAARVAATQTVPQPA